MLTDITPARAAFYAFLLALVTLCGAWIFEYLGYAPCELCLEQRYAYYLGIPLAALLAWAAGSQPDLVRKGLYLLALIWLGSMVFGIYHSGVEWKWWPGPGTCTGNGGLGTGLPDLSKPVVMCDEPALRILGLSLAGWNAIISLVIAVIALAGARSRAKAYGSSSVSQ